MIEYLLLLTITVALVLAVSNGVGKPLQNYVKNNVLDLVGCMLRVGQFPTQSFGLCQNAIQIKMDVAANLPDSGGDSAGSNNSSDTDSSDSDNNDQDNNNANQNDSSNNTNVRSNSRTGALNDSGNGSEFGDGDTKKIKIADDSESGATRFATGNNNFGETTVIVRRIKREDGRVGGSFQIGKDPSGIGSDDVKNSRSLSSQQTPTNDFSPAQGGKKFSIPETKDRGPNANAEDAEVSFSFLSMIKWIIIIGVLFFIVVFAASQLNSIRKGWTD